MHQRLVDSDIDLLEKQALLSAQRIFPCEDELLDAVPLNQIVHAQKTQLVSQTHPFLVRVAGQSGSGKSSQLVPALEYVLSSEAYIKINVGTFAPFHPQYKTLANMNPDLVREKTNGFALRALILFYRYCVEHKVNILFDMTLLEPEIEHYLMAIAKMHGYQIQLHVLCVPKKVSDYFIRQRYLKTGRYVSDYSANYFFNALAKGLKSLIGRSFFDKSDFVCLWSHYHARPLKKTTFFNPYVTSILMKQLHNRRIKNPSNLLKSKTTWLFVLYGK